MGRAFILPRVEALVHYGKVAAAEGDKQTRDTTFLLFCERHWNGIAINGMRPM